MAENDPERNDPERLAEQLEREADALGRGSGELERGAHEVREDWRRKRADPSIPGAVPEEAPEDDEETEGQPPEGSAPPDEPEDAEEGKDS